VQILEGAWQWEAFPVTARSSVPNVICLKKEQMELLRKDCFEVGRFECLETKV